MSALPLLQQELKLRTAWRGSARDAARQLGVSTSHLRSIVNGSANIGPKAAKRILAAIRVEELELADRIEAEMNAHWGRAGK